MNNQGNFPNMNMFAGNQNPQQQQQLRMIMEQMMANNGGFNQGMNMNSANAMQQMSELMMNQSNMQNFMRNYQNTMGQHHGMLGQNQGMLGQNQGSMGQNQGSMGQNQSSMGQNQEMFMQNQSMMEQNQGSMGQNHGMFRQEQGMLGQNQGMFGQNQGMMEQNHGIMGQNQGMFGQILGMTGQNQGIMGQNQGMTGQNNLTLGQNQGMMEIQTNATGIQQGMTRPSDLTDNFNQYQSGSFSNTPAIKKSEPNKLKSILKKSGSSSLSISSDTATASTLQPIKSILKKSTPASGNIVPEGAQPPNTLTTSHSKTITSQHNPVNASSITSIVQTSTSSLANISRHYSDHTKFDDKFTNSTKSTATPVSSSARMKTLVTVSTNQTFPSSQIKSSNPAPRSLSSNETTAYSKTSQSGSTTTVSSGLSIPTLVSSSGNRKRKTDNSEKVNLKKAKAEPSQASIAPRQDNDDEDPEYVQAQIFISNIDVFTTEQNILEILRHYKFSSPKVWIGKHNTSKEICAFVKLPSLKDSKRVIAEMKGFPYKGREMEIRFSAALDFIDYNVSDKDKELFTASKKSATDPQPVEQALPQREIPALTDTIVPVESVLAPIHVASDYQTVMVPIYPTPLPQYNEQYDDSSVQPPPLWSGSLRWQDNSQSYSEAYPGIYDGQSEGSDSRYKSDTRYSRSPDYRFDDKGRQYESSRHSANRSSLSPYSDRRYHSSLSRGGRSSISPYSHGRSSISPSRRRRSSISPRGQRSSISPPRGRWSSISPSRGRRSSISPSRGRRSSISPSRGRRLRDSPGILRRSRDGSYNRSVHSNDDSLNRGRGEPGTSTVSSSTYCVYIKDLPPHLEDSDLEILVRPYLYDGVRLKVKDGKAEASVTLNSRIDAELMVKDLNKKNYMGANLSVTLLDNASSGSLNTTKEISDTKGDKSSNKRKTVEDKKDRKDKTLFQSFIDASYVNAPVLGRKFIKEFVSHDRTVTFYLCVLCEKTCKSRDIADHVMGYKHRLKAIKQSDPKIYDKLCLIQDKSEMIKQCSEYADIFVNNSERVTSVTETYPEIAATDNLRRIQGRKRTTTGKTSDKEKLASTSEKRSAPDSTSDIFKKIAAYKKKFEACQDSTEEDKSDKNPAKRLRTGSGETGTKTSKFEDLQRENKSLADFIVAKIASARQDTDPEVASKRSDRSDANLKNDLRKTDKGLKNIGKRLENVENVRQKNKAKSVIKTSGKISDSEKKSKEFDRKSLQKAVEQSRARAEELKKALSMDNQECMTPVEDSQTSDGDKQSDKVQNEADRLVSEKLEVEDKLISTVVPTVGRDVSRGDEMKKLESVPLTKPVDVGKDDLRLEKTGVDIETVRIDANKSVQNTQKHRMGDSNDAQAENVKQNIVNEASIKQGATKHVEAGISAELLEEGLVDMEEEFELTEEMETEKELCVTLTNPSSHPKSTLINCLNDRLKAEPDTFALLGLEYCVEIIPRFGDECFGYFCSLCGVNVFSNHIFVGHLFGMKHKKKYLETYFAMTDKNFKGKIALSQKDVIVSESVKLWQLLKDNQKLHKIISMTMAEFKEKNMMDRQRRVLDFGIQEKGDTTEIKSVKDTQPVDTSFRDKINLAKQHARPVGMLEGRETVEFYKYMRLKPDVPILGLDCTFEIQGLYGRKTKASLYVCQLCNPMKKIDGVANFFSHLTGNKHMENYLNRNYPHKMIHLKLITQKHAKNAYLLNQAKLVWQTQGNTVGPIYMVNLVKLEEERKAVESLKAAYKAEEAAKLEAEAEAFRVLEKASTETLSETAKEQDRNRDEAAPAVKVANAEALDSTAGIGTSAVPMVIGLTDTSEDNAAPVTAHLYQIIAGVQDKAIVGLNYITEIHGIPEDGGLPRYQCSLCHDEIIHESRIKSHLIGNNHMLNFLKVNYPVFYSKAEGKYEEALSYCKEIEEQFGRESVSVKTRLKSASDEVIYSTPVISKAPVYCTQTTNVLLSSPVKKGKMYVEEGVLGEDIEFYKLLKNSDTGPLVGLQFLKEVHHPVRKCAPVYECLVCKIMDKSFLTTDSVLKHLHTTEHRLNFFKENHFHIYKEITSISDNNEMQKLLARRTEEIESKVGRGVVEKVVSNDISYWREDICRELLPESAEQKSSVLTLKPDEDQKQVECKKCHEIVAWRMRQRHIIAFHQSSLYSCNRCRSSFPSHRLLTRHNIAMEHFNPVVPMKNETNHNLSRWFQFHSEKGTVKKSNATGRLLQMCQRCDKLCKPDIARQHYISCHLQAYKCEVCTVPYDSGRELEEHLKDEHDIMKRVKPGPVPNFVKMSLYFWDVYSWEKTDKSESSEINKCKVEKSKITTNCGNIDCATIKSNVSSAEAEIIILDEETNEEKDKKTKDVSKSFDLSVAENQEKIMKEIKKLYCTRCLITYIHISSAYTHYKDRHAFQYICTHPKCYQKFPTRVRLQEHWSVKHKKTVDIKLPILSFSECYDVVLNNGERTSFGKALEIVQKSSIQNIEDVGTSCAKSTNSQISSNLELKSASVTSVDLDSITKPAISSVKVSNSQSVLANVPITQSASTAVKVSTPQPISSAVKCPFTKPSATTPQPISSTVRSPFAKPAAATTKIPTPSSINTSLIASSTKPTSKNTKVSNPSVSTSVKATSVSAPSLIVSNKSVICTSSVSQSQETCQDVIHISDTENSTLEALLAVKEDPLFDWDSEYDKIVEKMEFGGMISSARKSKFIINYSSTFCTYPLIGLQWITEFQKRDIRMEPWYICELCEDKVTFDSISAHITSVKHRVNYMEKMHPASYSAVKQTKFTSIGILKRKVESLSQEIIKKEGKHPVIKVMIEIPQSPVDKMSPSAEFTNPYLQGDSSKQVINMNVERNASMVSPNIQIQTLNKPTWESPGYADKSDKRLPPWQKISSFSDKKSSILAAAPGSNEDTWMGTNRDSRIFSHLPSSTVSKNQSGKPDLSKGSDLDVTCQTQSKYSKSDDQGHMKQRKRATRFSPAGEPKTARGDSVLDKDKKSLCNPKHLTATVLDESENDSKNPKKSTLFDVIDLTLDENNSEPELNIMSTEELDASINEHMTEENKQTDEKEILISTEMPNKPIDVLDPVNECSVEIDEEDFDFDGEFEVKDEVGEPDCMTIDVVPQSPEQVANPEKKSIQVKEVEDVTCSVEIKFDEGIESSKNTLSKCEIVEYECLSNEPVSEFSSDDINVLVMDTTDTSVEVEKSVVKDQELSKTGVRQKTKLADPMKESPAQLEDSVNHDEPLCKASELRNELHDTNASSKDTKTAILKVQQSQEDGKKIITSNVGQINEHTESSGKTLTKSEADNEIMMVLETNTSCIEKEENEDMLIDNIEDNADNTVKDTSSAIHLELADESVIELRSHQNKTMEGNGKMNVKQLRMECIELKEGIEDKAQGMKSDSLIDTATQQTVLEVSSESLLVAQDKISSLPNDTKLPDEDIGHCPSDSSSDIHEFAMDEFVTIDEHCEFDPEQTVQIHHVDNADCRMVEENKSSESVMRESSQLSCDPSNQDNAGPLSASDSVPLHTDQSAFGIVIDEGSNDSTDIEEIFLSNDFIDVDEQSIEEEQNFADVKQKADCKLINDETEGSIKFNASEHEDDVHKDNIGNDVIAVEIQLLNDEMLVHDSKKDSAEVEDIGKSSAAGQNIEVNKVSDDVDKRSVLEDMDENTVKAEVGRTDCDNVDKLDMGEEHYDLEDEGDEEEMDIDNFITLDELDTEGTEEVQLDVNFVDVNESEDVTESPQSSTTWKDKSKTQEIPVSSSNSSSSRMKQNTSTRQASTDYTSSEDKSSSGSCNRSQPSSSRHGSVRQSVRTDEGDKNISSNSSVETPSSEKSEKPSHDLRLSKATRSKSFKAVTQTASSSAETKTRRVADKQSESRSCHASRRDQGQSSGKDSSTSKSKRQTGPDKYSRSSHSSGNLGNRDNRTDSRHRSRNSSRQSGSGSDRQTHHKKERECKISIEID